MSNTEAKCFAADGITPTFTVPGQPIMVSAVDFNRVHAELADLRNAAVQAEPLYFVRLGDSAKWEETSEQIFEMSPDCYRTKLYTTPPAASAVGMTASADVGVKHTGDRDIETAILLDECAEIAVQPLG